MLFVVPDFYEDFHCLAGQCLHSCCIGWEIDIDEDSFAYYSGIEGEIGRELREKTSAEPTPHFILGENERCPFLNESGLCRLILALGEDSLCDICREHPRFYNEFSDRTEAGLGLCCEEAVRLLLEGEGPLRLLCYDDGCGEKPEAGEKALFSLREKIFALLHDSSRSLYSCMASCAELCGLSMPKLDMPDWAGFYLGLERLDPAWTDAIRLLADRGGEVPLRERLDGIKWFYVNSWGRTKEENLRRRSMWRATCSFFLGVMRHNGGFCCGNGRSYARHSKRVSKLWFCCCSPRYSH